MDKNFARCKICKKILNHSSSITNLKKHVKNVHPSAFANLAYPEELQVPPVATVLGSDNDDDDDGNTNADYDGGNDGCEDSNDGHTDKDKENLDGNNDNVEENNDIFDSGNNDNERERENVVAEKPAEQNYDENSFHAISLRTKNKNSRAWKYFTMLDHCSARCNICKDTFSYKTSVSNLFKHYTKVHGKNRKKTGCRSKRKKDDVPSSSDSDDSVMSCDAGATVGSDNEEPREEIATRSKGPPKNLTDALQAKRGKQPPGTKASYLWNFFTYIDSIFAQCDICKEKLVYKAGMSNLARHQRNKHPLQSKRKAPVNGPSREYPIQIMDVHDRDEIERRSRKYSYVWNFFWDLGKQGAQCKVCKKVLCYRTSLTNLMKHRRIKHPNEPDFAIGEKDGEKVIVDHNFRDEFKCRPTSKLWQFFKYINDEYAECKVCQKRLSHRYTTSNLLAHKNRQHPDVPLDHFPPDPPPPDESGENPNEDSGDDGATNKDDGGGGGSDDDDTPKRAPKLRRTTERSMVWRMFDRVDNTFSKCRFCDRLLSHRSTNHNLMKHVKGMHPHIYDRFSNMRNSMNALVDQFFPDATGAAVASIIEPVATTSAESDVQQQEIQIIIDGNQQSFEYGNMSSYTLPIIYIQDEQNPNNMKVVATGEMFTGSPTGQTGTVTESGTVAAEVHTTTVNTGCVPTTYFNINGNHVPVPTNLLNMAASKDATQNPEVMDTGTTKDAENASTNQQVSTPPSNVALPPTFLNINGTTVQFPTRPVPGTPSKVGENTVQVPSSGAGQTTPLNWHTPTAYTNSNNAQTSNITTPSKSGNGQMPTAYLNVNGNTVPLPSGFLSNNVQQLPAGSTATGSGLSTDFLLNQLAQSNKMMQEMQKSIDRQNEMILRLAENLGRKNRGQEEMLTD